MTNDEVKEWLVDSFESGAEWRERKAGEYPNDTRNMDAHKACLALRDSVASVPHALIEAFAGVRERLDPYRATEIESEAFRAVATSALADGVRSYQVLPPSLPA